MLQDVISQVLKFRDDRNWKQFHNPKDIAISISLEAAELLEIFQWSGSDLDCIDKREELADELADVMNYCILLADACSLDINDIMRTKLVKNAEKYPINKAYGNKAKYFELEESK